MEGFIGRNYHLLFGILLLGALGCAFRLGMIYTPRASASAVTLNCSDDVLKQLAIPLDPQSTTSTVERDSAPRTSVIPATTGQFMGSKNGTKYYTPDCASAKQIKPENVIWFASAEDAQLQGYTPASCIQ